MGATLVLAVTVGVFILARRLTGWIPVPNWFAWQELTVNQVTMGAATGSYSHIVLDSMMHPDIQPFSPFSTTNTLLEIMDVDTLHVVCLAAGLAAIIVIGIRRVVRA